MTPTLRGWFLRDLLIAVLASMLCAVCIYWYNTTTGFAAATAGTLAGFLSAYVLCYIVHEWGHQAGGVLAGADMPVNSYKGILLGQFDIAKHDTRQFLWLSWGGVAGYCATALIMLLFYFYVDLTWVGAGLAIGGLAFVFQSLSVDLPQIFKVMRGADPLETNRTGASGETILRRTWQSWTVLAVVLVLYNLL